MSRHQSHATTQKIHRFDSLQQGRSQQWKPGNATKGYVDRKGVTHVYRHAVQPLKETSPESASSNIGLARLVGARVAGCKLVELVLLRIETAEADREQDRGGGGETGHDGVVLDEERVGGERDESLADAAQEGNSRGQIRLNATTSGKYTMPRETYAEEMAVMKSWMDMTIERIDLGASASREKRASVKHSRFGTVGNRKRTGESVFESGDRRKDLGESDEDVGCMKEEM